MVRSHPGAPPFQPLVERLPEGFWGLSWCSMVSAESGRFWGFSAGFLYRFCNAPVSGWQGGGGRVFEGPPHQTALVWVVAENFSKGGVSFFWCWPRCRHPCPRGLQGASGKGGGACKGLSFNLTDAVPAVPFLFFEKNFGVEKTYWFAFGFSIRPSSLCVFYRAG